MLADYRRYSFFTLVGFLSLSLSIVAFSQPSSGTPEDDAYAAKVWDFMEANRYIGENRIGSVPFIGSRPHGSI